VWPHWPNTLLTPASLRQAAIYIAPFKESSSTRSFSGTERSMVILRKSYLKPAMPKKAPPAWHRVFPGEKMIPPGKGRDQFQGKTQTPC